MALLSFLSLVLSPILAFTVHAILTRIAFFKRFSNQKVALHAIVISCIFCSSFAFGLEGQGNNLPKTIVLIFIPILLGHLYFHVFNMSETARRIRILLGVYKGHFESRKAIVSTYVPTQMIEIRIGRLIAMGELKEKSGMLTARRTPLSFICKCLDIYSGFIFRRDTSSGFQARNPSEVHG